jgi:hypothetical protein
MHCLSCVQVEESLSVFCENNEFGGKPTRLAAAADHLADTRVKVALSAGIHVPMDSVGFAELQECKSVAAGQHSVNLAAMYDVPMDTHDDRSSGKGVMASLHGNKRFGRLSLPANLAFKDDQDAANVFTHDGWTMVDAPFTARRLLYSLLRCAEDNGTVDLKTFGQALNHLGVSSFSEYWALLLCGVPCGGPRQVHEAKTDNPAAHLQGLLLPQSMFSMQIVPSSHMGARLYGMVAEACDRDAEDLVRGWTRLPKLADMPHTKVSQTERSSAQLYWCPAWEINMERRHGLAWVVEALLHRAVSNNQPGMGDVGLLEQGSLAEAVELASAGFYFHGKLLVHCHEYHAYTSAMEVRMAQDKVIKTRQDEMQAQKILSSPSKAGFWNLERDTLTGQVLCEPSRSCVCMSQCACLPDTSRILLNECNLPAGLLLQSHQNLKTEAMHDEYDYPSLASGLVVVPAIFTTGFLSKTSHCLSPIRGDPASCGPSWAMDIATRFTEWLGQSHNPVVLLGGNPIFHQRDPLALIFQFDDMEMIKDLRRPGACADYKFAKPLKIMEMAVLGAPRNRDHTPEHFFDNVRAPFSTPSPAPPLAPCSMLCAGAQ